MTTTTSTPTPTIEEYVTKARAKGVTNQQLDHFFRHVEQLPSGCWQWTGSMNSNGLPLFPDCPGNTRDKATKRQQGRHLKTKKLVGDKWVYSEMKQPTAHRTAYYWFKGVLMNYPKWKLIQTCGHRGCVNPAHLRQVRVVEVAPVTLHTDTLTAIFSRVTVTPETGCWTWTGDVNVSGYPVLEMGGHPRAIDVLCYGWFVGYGLGEAETTHLPLHHCGVRACIHPAHMELVPTHMRRQLAAPPATEEGATA